LGTLFEFTAMHFGQDPVLEIMAPILTVFSRVYR
jgi:hypothetical protein